LINEKGRSKINPSATFVRLAFAAGFSSETILLWIREVVDKLRPEGEEVQTKGSLAETVSALTDKATAEESEKGIAVAIVGRGELVPTYRPNDQFAFNGNPEREHSLEVKIANQKSVRGVY